MLTVLRWEVTVAMLSRREIRIPTKYLDAISELHDAQSWDFFTLYGCPMEFLRHMAELSKLASIYEKTKAMEWTIFNVLPVDVIIEHVRQYRNPECVDVSALEHDEADVEAQYSRYLCIEAWRNAILLYICRVFRATQDAPSLRQIDHHKRLILDSVRCIPETDFTQKQMLLPVFLAGAEAGTERDRSVARSYCAFWDQTSRFGHFGSAGQMLEEIWAGWAEDNRSDYWWGVLPWTISADGPLATEVLLG